MLYRMTASVTIYFHQLKQKDEDEKFHPTFVSYSTNERAAQVLHNIRASKDSFMRFIFRQSSLTTYLILIKVSNVD